MAGLRDQRVSRRMGAADNTSEEESSMDMSSPDDQWIENQRNTSKFGQIDTIATLVGSFFILPVAQQYLWTHYWEHNETINKSRAFVSASITIFLGINLLLLKKLVKALINAVRNRSDS